MRDVTLPGARAALVGAGNLTERPFYVWMQAVDKWVTKNTSSGDSSVEAIREIALKLGSPDGSVEKIPAQGTDAVINGGGSIQIDGTLESGVVNITLMYDTLLPGPSTYYGADSTGKRGWFPIAATLADSADIDVVTDGTTGISSFNLKPTGVTAGTYGGGPKFLIVAVGADGRIDAISAKTLIAGTGITLTTDPVTGDVTIAVFNPNPNIRVTRGGDQRVTQAGDIRVTR